MALSPQEVANKTKEISGKFSLCRICEPQGFCQIASAWLAADSAARQTLNSEDNFQNCPGKEIIKKSTETTSQ